MAAAPASSFGAAAAAAAAPPAPRMDCIICIALAISALESAPSLSASTIGRYCTTGLKRGALRNSAAVSLPSILSSSAPKVAFPFRSRDHLSGRTLTRSFLEREAEQGDD